MIAMDNNQRGQRKKQLWEGTGNIFIAVKNSMAIKPLKITSICPNVAPYHPRNSPIIYLNYAIVSVNGMSGYDNLHTIKDVISYISIDNTHNYSDKRMNSYYSVAKSVTDWYNSDNFCPVVIKYLDSWNKVQPLIGILHSNRTLVCLYTKAKYAQRKEGTQWFGHKNKVQMSFYQHRMKTRTPVLYELRYDWTY